MQKVLPQSVPSEALCVGATQSASSDGCDNGVLIGDTSLFRGVSGAEKAKLTWRLQSDVVVYSKRHDLQDFRVGGFSLLCMEWEILVQRVPCLRQMSLQEYAALLVRKLCYCVCACNDKV